MGLERIELFESLLPTASSQKAHEFLIETFFAEEKLAKLDEFLGDHDEKKETAASLFEFLQSQLLAQFFKKQWVHESDPRWQRTPEANLIVSIYHTLVLLQQVSIQELDSRAKGMSVIKPKSEKEAAGILSDCILSDLSETEIEVIIHRCSLLSDFLKPEFYAEAQICLPKAA